MAQATETSDVQSGQASAEDVVRSAFEAIARRDLSALAPHYSPDIVEDVVPIGVLRGRDEVLAFFTEVFAALPELEMTLTRIVAGEREVVAEWRLRGRFDGGEFQGIAATGRWLELRGLDLFEVEDGLIVGNTAYYDGAEFARQVGMMPQQDSGAERALKGAFNTVTKLRTIINERTGS